MAEITPKMIEWPGEGELREKVLNYVRKYGDIDKASQSLTPAEQEALKYLGYYTEGQAGPTYAAGEQEILKTLAGEYDPTTSPYYEPTLKAIEQRRDTARDRLRRGYNLGGNLSSLARARAESESDISYEGQISDMLMGLQERERERRLGVLPQAAAYGQYTEESPLRRAEALLSVGNIPRQLETGAINMGQQTLTGYRPTYYWPMYSSTKSGGASPWGGAASGALGGAAMGSAFGPWGTAIGAGVGGLMGYFGY